MIKKLIGSAAKIRQGRARHCGIEGKIHHGRQLTKVPKEQAGTASEQCVSTMGKPLAKTLVDLSKDLSPYHRHLIYDEIIHPSPQRP